MLNKVSKELLGESIDCDVQLSFDEADFTDEPEKAGKVMLVMNENTGRIGVVSVDVVEYPDELISYFILKMEQYKYFKAEGFTSDEILVAEGLEDNIFKHLYKSEFFDYILGKDYQ